MLSVSAGRSTPYYYKADGIMEAYIRIGNESVIAPSYALNQLILKGMHRTYDELISEYDLRITLFPSCGSGIRRGQETAWKKSCSIPLICGMRMAS